VRIPALEQPLAARPRPFPGSADTGSALDKDYEILLDAFGFEPSSIDSLEKRSGLQSEALTSMLWILELEGRIAPYPGGRYGRVDS
jgi:DNA processing protein